MFCIKKTDLIMQASDVVEDYDDDDDDDADDDSDSVLQDSSDDEIMQCVVPAEPECLIQRSSLQLLATRGTQVVVLSKPSSRRPAGGGFQRPVSLLEASNNTRGRTWVNFEAVMPSSRRTNSLH